MNLFFKLICLLLSLVSFYTYAIENPLNASPITIDADKLEYSGEPANMKLTALGNVEAVQDNQKLMANFLEYNYSDDTIIAKEDVKIFEKNGYIIDANEISLRDKMKYGAAKRISILMPDKSTLKAKSAAKNNDRWTDIKDGSYTACKICAGKSPIWQITASKAELDEDRNRMHYKHAVLDYYGVPVFYTPYFAHYTSKAERQSGFLYPSYGGSSYLGEAIKLPYYLNLAPNYDATITPIFTTQRGNALEGEYRHLFSMGQVNNKGSITTTKRYQAPSGQAPLKHAVRYNFNSETDLALSDSKNLGWNVNTVSDKSYMSNYNYAAGDFLTSRVYNNNYQSNGYYEVQAMAFENLRPETSISQNQMHQTPMIMPLFESKHQIHQFSDHSKWSFEGNMLKVHRYFGADSNRFSIKNKWQKSMLFNNGQHVNVYASLRDDLYYYENATLANDNNVNYTGYTSRHIPEAGADWSYLLGKKMGDNFITISPVVSAVITPYTNYNKDIYNEDSGNYNEINDANLFANSQFNGIDLVENTPRVSYGLKSNMYHKDNFTANALLGQMYQQKPQSALSDSGREHLSDYVGRLKFDFNDRFIVSYQFTLDNQTLKNKTNELTTTYKYQKAYITADLLYYRNDVIVNDVKNRRELYLETGINDYKNFSVSAFARRSLTSRSENPTLYTPASGFVSFGSKLNYTNDCITYFTSLNRDLTRSNDKQKNTTIWFGVSLKNIGGTQQKVN